LRISGSRFRLYNSRIKRASSTVGFFAIVFSPQSLRDVILPLGTPFFPRFFGFIGRSGCGLSSAFDSRRSVLVSGSDFSRSLL
jgi:hypothetical protein